MTTHDISVMMPLDARQPRVVQLLTGLYMPPRRYINDYVCMSPSPQTLHPPLHSVLYSTNPCCCPLHLHTPLAAYQDKHPQWHC